jgi:UDP-N-acetylmuramate dehydrogenase
MSLRVRENLPLAEFTTLGIGGPARYLVQASTEEAVREGIEFAGMRGLPLLVLGGGSNLLVSDEGFPGVVLEIRIGGLRFVEEGERVSVRAGAGIDWDGLVAECVGRDLYGIECLSGIPGRVGATPVQNVGAYGQEVSDVIRRVRVYDRLRDEIDELTSRDCGFDYRASVFNTSARGRYLVLGVVYELEREGAPRLDYPDLERRFRDGKDNPPLSEVREAVLAIRRGKAMLLEAGDPDSRSAGSFFKNPVVSASKLAEIAATAREQGSGARPEDVPGFRLPSGEVKVSAAWLIERSGFRKGKPEGRVGLSSRHALALVNRGGGTAADVLGVAWKIRERVKAVFGLGLSTEPAFVGFPDSVIQRFGAAPAC